MPGVDLYRNTGPEDSMDYKIFQKKETNKEPMKRKDRKDSDLRRVFLKTGVISHAKGSSYIEVGDTKVEVAVYGPREIPKRSDFSMKGILSCEMKYAPFACATRRGHQRDAEEIEMSLLLKECLESTVRMNLYHKSRIDVFVTVLEDGGGVLAASITATGLALVDAQIDMYDNLIGCGISIHKDRLLVDPCLEEEVSCSDAGQGFGNLTVGYLNTSEQVVCLFSQGVLKPEAMDDALNLAVKKCEEMLPAVQECQINSLQKKLSKMNQQ